MTTPPSTPQPSIWATDHMAEVLRRRLKTFWNRDYLEGIVVPLLALPTGAQVLDVGSGYGVLTLLLAQLRPDAAITGIDLEPHAIASATTSAAELGLTNVRFQTGDAAALPFAAGSFDAALCQTVLTHVPDASRVVSEMARVLRAGGSFLAVEFHNTGALQATNNVTAAWHDQAWRDEWYRLWQLCVVGKRRLGKGDDTVCVRIPFLARDAGLEVIDVRLNDRVMHALPPYKTSGERADLAQARAFNSQPADSQFRAELTTWLHAGGATTTDIERFFELWDNPRIKHDILQAIDDGHYAVVCGQLVYLTFGRKGGANEPVQT